MHDYTSKTQGRQTSRLASSLFICLVILLLMIACGQSDTANSSSGSAQLTNEPAVTAQSDSMSTPEEFAEPVSVTYVARVLGVVVDKNMIILHVEPNSGADGANLQEGDEVVTVNGIKLKYDKNKAKEEIRRVEAGQTIKLKVKKKGGSEKDVEVAVQYQQSYPTTPTPIYAPQDYL